MTTRQFQESSALRSFLSYFKPHRKLFFLDMCCALMIAVIDLAFPYVSRWCMYQLLPESAYRTFFAVMAVVFCAYILRSVFTYIYCYYGHTIGLLVEAGVRRMSEQAVPTSWRMLSRYAARGTGPNMLSAGGPQRVRPTARATVKCAARSGSAPCISAQ